MKTLKGCLENKKEIFKEILGTYSKTLWLKKILEKFFTLVRFRQIQYPYNIGETSPGQLAHMVERWMHRRGFKRLTVHKGSLQQSFN